jgi:hypothetical protein
MRDFARFAAIVTPNAGERARFRALSRRFSNSAGARVLRDDEKGQGVS